jgi:hypothetical protein
MRLGQCKRVNPEYRRCGVSSVFMLSEPLAGKRHVHIRSRRPPLDFAQVIRELCDELYGDAQKIVLVMDNLNTHATASSYEAFEPVSRVVLRETVRALGGRGRVFIL